MSDAQEGVKVEWDARTGMLSLWLPLGALFGLMMLVGAFGFGHPTVLEGVAAIAGFVVPVGLYVYLYWRALIIDDAGVTARTIFGAKRIAWDDLAYYRYTSLTRFSVVVGSGLVGGPLAMLAAGSIAAKKGFAFGALRVYDKRGTRITIDRRYEDVASAIERCFGDLHARLPGDDFAPFAIRGDALAYAGRELALTDIERVAVSSGRIRVFARGKTLAWASSTMGGVRNAVMFVEALARRGVAVRTSDGVYMPGSARPQFPEAHVVQR